MIEEIIREPHKYHPKDTGPKYDGNKKLYIELLKKEKSDTEAAIAEIVKSMDNSTLSKLFINITLAKHGHREFKLDSETVKSLGITDKQFEEITMAIMKNRKMKSDFMRMDARLYRPIEHVLGKLTENEGRLN